MGCDFPVGQGFSVCRRGFQLGWGFRMGFSYGLGCSFGDFLMGVTARVFPILGFSYKVELSKGGSVCNA